MNERSDVSPLPPLLSREVLPLLNSILLKWLSIRLDSLFGNVTDIDSIKELASSFRTDGHQSGQ